jgi:hypothetical protein
MRVGAGGTAQKAAGVVSAVSAIAIRLAGGRNAMGCIEARLVSGSARSDARRQQGDAEDDALQQRKERRYRLRSRQILDPGHMFRSHRTINPQVTAT